MPILAANFDENRLTDGSYAKSLGPDDYFMLSPKLDGVRCTIGYTQIWSDKTGSYERIWSRNGKPIPNKFIRQVLETLPGGLDGEIGPVAIRDKDAYKQAIHAAMTIEGKPEDWCFFIFNMVPDPDSEDFGLANRLERAKAAVSKWRTEHPDLAKYARFVEHTRYEAHEHETILQGAKAFSDAGYEGAMLSCSNAPYLNKRVSPTKPWLLKLKPFLDAEATIIGMLPGRYGTNLKTVPEHLWGTAKEEVGALLLRDCKGAFKVFKCGSGLNAKQKKEFWANRQQIIADNTIVTFKYLEVGTDERPRHPIFLRVRLDANA